MSFIGKIVGNFIAIVYGIIVMPFILLILIMSPIMSITDGIKIIREGSTVTNEYISIMVLCMLAIYFSLRFKYVRKVYVVFPFLFETVKFLTMTLFFTGIATDFINWRYTYLDDTSRKIGIAGFIVILVLWRVFISIFYYKKPLSIFNSSNAEIVNKYER